MNKHHTYKDQGRKGKIPVPSTFFRLFCFLFRKKIVKLIDYEDEVRFSYALFGCPCEEMHCYVYPFTQIGDCILKADGSIDPKSSVLYIKTWSFC